MYSLNTLSSGQGALGEAWPRVSIAGLLDDRFRSGPWPRNRTRYERSGRLRLGCRMSGHAMLLVAGIFYALMAIDVHATTCNKTKAKEHFVEAANIVREAERLSREKKLKKLEEAREILQEFMTGAYKCTSIAVRLASGQSIGNISIARLATEIAILEKKIPPSCQAALLCNAIESALEIKDSDMRDPIIATIARKLVRRDAFRCAQDLVELIEGEKEKEMLRHHITRAQVRDRLTTERCCSWPSP